MKHIELLAPAKNAEIAIHAINHGADAVYIGAPRFGARALACNSVEDIKRVIEYAHNFNVKVYVTLNTLIYDYELHDAEQLIRQLYKIGTDALIIQDMGILRLDIPPIALHASTQCDIRSPQKAKFLEAVGFSQLVLARELCLNEIKQIHDTISIPIEAFIHGALCVSYSGRCEVSEVCKGRSANRGECAQICRLPYTLIDSKDRILLRNKHLLSLKDLNRSGHLLQLIDAGVSSFKIEGRLKDADYVKNVVSFYRQQIDEIIALRPDMLCRSSCGVSHINFVPKLEKSFNRGFTSYFFESRKPDVKMASLLTPKSIGEPMGLVSAVGNKRLSIESAKYMTNGDGVSYFDKNGEYKGFRINKVVGDTASTLEDIKIAKGTRLYRTYDKLFQDCLSQSSPTRKLMINADLKYRNGVLSLTLSTEGHEIYVSCCESVGDLELAKSAQDVKQKDSIGRMGNSIFEIGQIDTVGRYFIPGSVLSILRRKTAGKLLSAIRTTYTFEYRRDEQLCEYLSKGLIYSDNVANSLAKRFYESHGVDNISPAIETDKSNISGNEVLMHTRYCLRRELDACKLGHNASKLPEDLFLISGNIRLKVVCDCTICEMRLYKV